MIQGDLIRYNLADKKFLFFDMETEGLSLTMSKPWLLGWQVYHGLNKIEEQEHYIDWPGLSVSKDAARVTHFNPQIIKEKGENPKEIIDLFDKYLYNPEYNIVFANGFNFDVYIHNIARLELGYKSDYSYINRSYDTIALSKAYKLGIKIPEKKEDFLAFQYKMASIRQKGLKSSNSFMAKEFGMEVDDMKAHSSTIYDCDMTFHVFRNLINKMDIK